MPEHKGKGTGEEQAVFQPDVENRKEQRSDALDILAGRIYRQGHAWSDFSTEGIAENTAYVFDFQGEST